MKVRNASRVALVAACAAIVGTAVGADISNNPPSFGKEKSRPDGMESQILCARSIFSSFGKYSNHLHWNMFQRRFP
jgi:hypothetical protein